MPFFDVVTHFVDKKRRYVIHLERAFSFPACYFVLFTALLDLFDFLFVEINFGFELLYLGHFGAVNPEFAFGAGHNLLCFHRIHCASPPKY